MFILNIILALLFVYLAGSVLYLLFYALHGIKPKKIRHLMQHTPRKFAVLIPAYKEDQVIIETAKFALNQHYPSHLYDVIVIADSCQLTTLSKLRKLPIQVIEVSFDQSTKSKAINRAMDLLPQDYYDACVVLDADNIMAPNFIQLINNAFEQGFKAVQGHRTAKNVNTPIAVLDALSEEINNWIFRRGHQAAGLSSALIGSGMAFDYKLFREVMQSIQAVGGFDKELELKLMERHIKIGYIENAKVLDEKVQNERAFVPQRTRWLAAQFHYARTYLGSAFQEYVQFKNLDFFNKALQFILPPRILLIGSLPLLSVFSLAIGLHTWSLAWIGLTILLASALFIALPQRFVQKGLWPALKHLPVGFWMMLKALLKSPKGNKSFLHTPHSSINTLSN